MYTLALSVWMHTLQDPVEITDTQEIMSLSGFSSKEEYAGIALWEHGAGLVLSKSGKYKEVPHGYFVSYSEEDVLD
jgi:hypothetical protein